MKRTTPESRGTRASKAKEAEQGRVRRARESFGEDVSQVCLGRNFPNGKKSLPDELADEEIAQLDVLGAGVVDMVLGEMDGASVVTPEGGAALRSAQLSKNIAEPAGLMSDHGASVELSVAQGESNGRRMRGAPTDKAAAKGEAIALRGAAIRLLSGLPVAEVREERREGAAKGEDMVLGPAKIAEDPLSGLPVLGGVEAGANEARKHADGVGKVGTGAHHGIHQRPNKIGIRVSERGGRGGWGKLVTER
ncbi:unnamed protein product [Closterium sp. NIES-54]